MNILVFDVAAEHGGALTILNEFYNYVKNNPTPNVKWTFIISTPCFESSEHVNVKNYPWVKKSWFHRLYFDYFVAPKLVTEYKADKVFSLQNICVPRVNKPQIIYVHQPLPFTQYRFKLFQNPLFWVYQNIIGKLIINSMKKAYKVIVQTNWMRCSCSKFAEISKDKFIVCSPSINLQVCRTYSDTNKNRRVFFYPAAATQYKNHMIILHACKILKGKNIDFQIIFTIKSDENKLTKMLKSYCDTYDLNVQFIGKLEKTQLVDLYSSSTLIFPSYIETFGLPLLEAKLCGSIILASDLDYAREVVSDYKNAIFFDCFDSNSVANAMIHSIQDFPYQQHFSNACKDKFDPSWEIVIKAIVKG